MTFFDFLLLSLACFRLTRLVVYDKIFDIVRAPFMVIVEEEAENGEKEIYFEPKEKGLKGFIGELISCYWCVGIWSATGIYFFYWLFPAFVSPLLIVLAIAGLASIIESIIQVWIY